MDWPLTRRFQLPAPAGRSRHFWCRTLIVVCAVLALSGSAWAQGRADVNAGQFDFSLPGARSLAMGGAFLAVARDATSAYSNPAGLTYISSPEVSIELRNWNFTNTAIDRGHGFGEPTGIGVDTVPGLVEESFTADRSGASYVSAVYPRKNWAIGLFRHEIPRFETEKEINGPFFDCDGGFRTDDPPAEPFCLDHARADGVDRIFPKRQDIAIDIYSLGASFAYRFENVPLSIGISVLHHKFEFDAVNDVFSARDEKKYQAADFSEANREVTSVQAGDDSELGINAGFLWESTRWSVGGAYRQGPEFEYSIVRLAGPARTDRSNPGDVLNEVPDSRFKVPDTWALGVAYRPLETFIVSLQYDWVGFSQLTEDFVEEFLSDEESAVVNSNLTTDDAHRLRLGLEKLWFTGSNVWALRVGGWWDSDHRTRFEADPETGHPAPRWATLFPEGDDEMHLTFGGGVVINERWQIDAGADLSDLIDTYSLSLVWRFAKSRKPDFGSSDNG